MDRHAIKFSATLSTIEVGIGSFLHAFHIPFRGQCLALNQGFLLSRAGFTGASDRKSGIRLSNLISLTAACLKSLSPAGNRLTPMLAISVQGLLFSLGQALGGVSLGGHLLGITLVSTWALGQSILLGWLLNGDAFLLAIQFAFQQTGADWFVAIAGILLFLIGLALVVLSKHMSADAWLRYQTKFAKPSAGSKRSSIPWFALFSIAISVGFLIYIDSPAAHSIWVWLRPLAMLILFGMILHFVPPERLSAGLKKIWPALGDNVEQAHRSLIER